jgi:hypothetical protein
VAVRHTTLEAGSAWLGRCRSFVVREVYLDGKEIRFRLVNIGDTSATIVESRLFAEVMQANSGLRPLFTNGTNELGRLVIAPGESGTDPTARKRVSDSALSPKWAIDPAPSSVVTDTLAGRLSTWTILVFAGEAFSVAAGCFMIAACPLSLKPGLTRTQQHQNRSGRHFEDCFAGRRLIISAILSLKRSLAARRATRMRARLRRAGVGCPRSENRSFFVER